MNAGPVRALLRWPVRVGWRDHAVGASFAAAYVAWLLATARSLGFPRDEGFYFRAAHEYGGWWRLLFERGHDALSQGAIDSAWSYNHEHPALMKSLFGISEWLLHDAWRVFDDTSTAMRFPTMCMAGVALWTTYLFGARAWSRRAGAVAAALLALMPRVFFHAHLACFDVPIMTMWLLCVYAAWRAQETGRLRWAVATGLLFGLALETKHNAWILPFVIVPHAFFAQRRALWQNLRAGRVPIPASVVAMAVLGPAVFLALWPYLWNETFERIQWYVSFHLNHEYYNIEFLGKNYFGPPSPPSYLPVLVAATVPSVTVVLFLVGALDRASAGLRRLMPWRSQPPTDRAETDVLMALSFFAAIGPFFLPKTPIFGGTKHWLPAYPILALWAGHGFDLVLGAMKRALSSLTAPRLAAAEAALVATVVLPPLAITAHSHPFGLSAYVPLVGGTAGGADLGLNRQFWGYTSQNAAAEYLNANAPPGASVFIHDTAWDSWAHMQDEGRVRRDLRAVGAPHDAQIALVMHELHMSEVDYSVWVAFGDLSPTYIVEHDGVPIVSIYRR